jgi:hypothetical protein
MHDRSVLGPADVSDEALAAMAADLLGLAPDRTTLLDSGAEVVAYDLDSITTAGRYWVHGHVTAGNGALPFRMFVKHVQSWSRSPYFASVPVEFQAEAERSVPWRTEPLAYRSDLGDRLPAGLSMPRAVGVIDIDEKAGAVWLEEVPVVPVTWDVARHARAARLLGRLAASPRVAELAGVGRHDFHVRDYLHGRLNLQVLPMLHDEDIWRHPLVAATFDGELRERLLVAADRATEYVAELAVLPFATAHGDACPNNLLVRPDQDGFVLIDYGFWGEEPIGFDLAQLLVGDVQVGRRSAADLPALEEACLAAYVAGLRDEGCDVAADVVRRAHALQLLVFTGYSTLPFELLDGPPTPERLALSAERAAIARFSLDLVDASA